MSCSANILRQINWQRNSNACVHHWWCTPLFWHYVQLALKPWCESCERAFTKRFTNLKHTEGSWNLKALDNGTKSMDKCDSWCIICFHESNRFVEVGPSESIIIVRGLTRIGHQMEEWWLEAQIHLRYGNIPVTRRLFSAITFPFQQGT